MKHSATPSAHSPSIMRTLMGIFIALGIGLLAPIAASADEPNKGTTYNLPEDLPPEIVPLATEQVHDTVLITHVSDQTLVEGVPTKITVEVTYFLESRPTAALAIGFNELIPGSPTIKARIPITKGNGVRTVQISVNPRIWSQHVSFQAHAAIECLTDDGLSHWAPTVDSKRLAVAAGPISSKNMAANAKPQETFRDGISIVSITPDSLKSGEQATVTVRVRYELFSCNEAEINLGFNEGRGNGYRIDAKKVVGIGSGEATLSASLTAKKTGTMPLMKVFVNLSEYPHRSTWSPLCDDNGEIATE